jgi:RHS repeat-associated protein
VSGVEGQSVYYPFGGERVITNNVANNYKFTGLERDSETGLDHTLNRQYSSNLGRWLSADPVRGCVMNPQKFDRYSYVLDNPATLTDLNGDQPDEFANPECEDFFFATTHAECGPPSGPFVNPDMLDLIELREELREERKERNKCRGMTSKKPKSPFGSLCGDFRKGKQTAKFIEEWTCSGDVDCCQEKKEGYINSCYDRGPGYFAAEREFWNNLVVDCCYLP